MVACLRFFSVAMLAALAGPLPAQLTRTLSWVYPLETEAHGNHVVFLTESALYAARMDSEAVALLRSTDGEDLSFLPMDSGVAIIARRAIGTDTFRIRFERCGYEGTDNPTLLYTIEGWHSGGNWALTPDQSTVVYAAVTPAPDTVGAIFRVPLSGEQPAAELIRFPMANGQPPDLAVIGADAYTLQDRDLWRVPLSGETPTKVYTEPPHPGGATAPLFLRPEPGGWLGLLSFGESPYYYERLYRPSENLAVLSPAEQLLFSPDAKKAIGWRRFANPDPSLAAGLWSLRTLAGEATLLHAPEGSTGPHRAEVSWSANVALTVMDGHLILADLAAGGSTTLTPPETAVDSTKFGLAGNGTRALFLSEGRLWSIPFGPGMAADLGLARRWLVTPDEQRVVVHATDTQRLQVVPLAGGPPGIMTDLVPFLYGLFLSPDGRKVFFWDDRGLYVADIPQIGGPDAGIGNALLAVGVPPVAALDSNNDGVVDCADLSAIRMR